MMQAAPPAAWVEDNAEESSCHTCTCVMARARGRMHAPATPYTYRNAGSGGTLSIGSRAAHEVARAHGHGRGARWQHTA